MYGHCEQRLTHVVGGGWSMVGWWQWAVGVSVKGCLMLGMQEGTRRCLLHTDTRAGSALPPLLRSSTLLFTCAQASPVPGPPATVPALTAHYGRSAMLPSSARLPQVSSLSELQALLQSDYTLLPPPRNQEAAVTAADVGA